MRKFITDVNSKSGGRLEITGYYMAVLGSANDAFQQMERGELEVYFGQPMSAIYTRFGAWSTPYLFKNYDEIAKIARDPNSEFFKLSAEWIGDHNAVLPLDEQSHPRQKPFCHFISPLNFTLIIFTVSL
jgi:TRAP-type C4-dicarboxylate transport system substrate-binding protein